MQCPICGKEFTPRRSDQKFCSARCRNVAKSRRYNERHRERLRPPEVKTCPECGKEFVSKSRAHKFCCEDCQKKNYYKNHTEHLEFARKKDTAKRAAKVKPPPPPRKCLRCGKEFVPAFVGDKFCSDDCCWDFYPPRIRNALGKVLGEVWL